jgi:hypothetical protein
MGQFGKGTGQWRYNLDMEYHSNEDGTVTVHNFGPMIRLESDVAEYFPDAESVNNALRTLIALVPDRKIGEKIAKYKVSKKTTKRVAAKK